MKTNVIVMHSTAEIVDKKSIEGRSTDLADSCIAHLRRARIVVRVHIRVIDAHERSLLNPTFLSLTSYSSSLPPYNIAMCTHSLITDESNPWR